jgi:hypothetical protein
VCCSLKTILKLAIQKEWREHLKQVLEKHRLQLDRLAQQLQQQLQGLLFLEVVKWLMAGLVN